MNRKLKKSINYVLLVAFAIVALAGGLSMGAGTVSVQAANAVQNPGFESGTASWSVPAHSSVVSTDKYAGTYSLKLTGTADWCNTFQNMPVTANTVYTLSFYAKAGAAHRVKVTDGNNWGTILKELTVTANNTWTNYTATFNSGSSTTVNLVVADAASGTTYFDNFSIDSGSVSTGTPTPRPSTSTPTPTPGPTPAGGIIGNTTDGTLTDNTAANYYNAIRYQAASSMTVNQMRIKIAAAGTGRMKCAIYSDNAGNPGSLLRSTAERSALGAGWQTFTLTSTLSLASGSYYWLVSWRDGAYGISSTSATGCNRWGALTYAASFPSTLPASGGSADYRHSFYAANGATPSPAPSTPTPRPSTPTPTPTSAPTSPPGPTPAKGNIGVGINLQFFNDWETSIPFKNIIKMGRQWNNTANPGFPQDVNGYPTSLGSGQRAQMLFARDGCPTLSDMTGSFVLLYDGQGTVTVSGTGVTNVVSNPGRITFSNSSGKYLEINITATTPTNYVRNMRCIKAEYESNYISDPFVPNFVNKIINKFNTIRFMDWQKTNSSTQSNWSDRVPGGYYTYNTYLGKPVPVEALVELCNKTGSNGWFCMPHLATDDYITQFATYVRNNLASNLKAYIEFSNECWNPGYAFQQQAWCVSQAQSQSITREQFYAKMCVRMFHIWENVFTYNNTVPSGKDRLVRVIAGQADWGGADQVRQIIDYSVDSAAAYTHCDAIAIAPYMNIGTANGTVTQILDALQADIYDTSSSGVTGQIRNHKALINARGNNDRGVKPVLVAYEGGQHLTGYGNDSYTTLHSSCNRNSRMGDLYTRYMNVWKAEGGQLFNHFNNISAHGSEGMWGLLEHQDETSTPKYNALTSWITANPKWW